VSVVESAKDEQLCEVKVCCKPVLEDGGRDKVKKYTREELLHLGSLPENKVPLASVDWENDVSLKELDQRAGRRDPAPQLPSSVGDDIALKPHWLRAGSGGAGTLYRSSSSDTKGSPIPPAGPLRSRLVDGAGDGGGEPMSSSLPASGNRTSERNASGMQRGWRLSNDKDRDGSSIVPRSPQHSYERPGPDHAAGRDGEPTSRQRWVDKQGNDRWRTPQAAKAGGSGDAHPNQQHSSSFSHSSRLEDRWKTHEERHATDARPPRQSQRHWDDDERRGRPGQAHNHHNHHDNHRSPYKQPPGSSNHQQQGDADDDQPAWMSPEPVQPVKMTPADIERERQAFREQHNRAKQAAAQKDQKRSPPGNDVFEEVDLDELMDDDQRMAKNLPPMQQRQQPTQPPVAPSTPDGSAPPQGIKMSFDDLAKAMSSGAQSKPTPAGPAASTLRSAKALTLDQLEKQLQGEGAPPPASTPTGATAAAPTINPASSTAASAAAAARGTAPAPRAAKLGPPPGIPPLSADLNASRALLSLLKGTPLNPGPSAAPAAAASAGPAAAAPQPSPSAPPQQQPNLLQQLQKSAAQQQQQQQQQASPAQGAAQQPNLLQQLQHSAMQQQQQQQQQQKPSNPIPPLPLLKPSAPPLAPTLGIPKPHIPVGVLNAFGETQVESNASSIWGGPLGTMSKPLPPPASAPSIAPALAIASTTPAKPSLPVSSGAMGSPLPASTGAMVAPHAAPSPPAALNNPLAALFARGGSGAVGVSSASAPPQQPLPVPPPSSAHPPFPPPNQAINTPESQQQQQQQQPRRMLPPTNPLAALFARVYAAQQREQQQRQQQQQQLPLPPQQSLWHPAGQQQQQQQPLASNYLQPRQVQPPPPTSAAAAAAAAAALPRSSASLPSTSSAVLGAPPSLPLSDGYSNPTSSSLLPTQLPYAVPAGPPPPQPSAGFPSALQQMQHYLASTQGNISPTIHTQQQQQQQQQRQQQILAQLRAAPPGPPPSAVSAALPPNPYIQAASMPPGIPGLQAQQVLDTIRQAMGLQ